MICGDCVLWTTNPVPPTFLVLQGAELFFSSVQVALSLSVRLVPHMPNLSRDIAIFGQGILLPISTYSLRCFERSILFRGESLMQLGLGLFVLVQIHCYLGYSGLRLLEISVTVWSGDGDVEVLTPLFRTIMIRVPGGETRGHSTALPAGVSCW